MRQVLPYLGALCGAAVFPVSAATFVVDSIADTTDASPGDGTCADATGDCSLRAAIQEANALAGADEIELAARRYTLALMGAGEDAAATGDLDITSETTVNGGGAIIDANGLDRAFDVIGSASLTLSRVDIVNGNPPSTESGGGIRNGTGTLTVNGGEFSKNAVLGAGASGGGIFNGGGTLNVTGTVFDGNSAERAGGAIEANAGTTNLTRIVAVGNMTGPSPGNGGGLHLTGAGTVTVLFSKFEGNVAALEGGGLWNSADGTMVTRGSTFVGNDAQGAAADNGGGALFNDGGTMEVYVSDIVGNQALGASGSGGGILNDGGSLLVSGGTISNNSAARAGGGIESNLGSNTLRNTTLYFNFTGSAPGNGGGLHITGAGSAEVIGTLVSSNLAVAEGGGLWNGSGVMNVRNSTIRNNTASGAGADQGGGGLFNAGGSLTVVGSQITGNFATTGSGSGGGILNDQGSLTVVGSVVRVNNAVRAGGGIEANIGDTRVFRSTLIGNNTGSNPGNGGGLHLTGAGEVRVADSGVYDNNAENEGGGLWNSSTGLMIVNDSEITNNTSPTGPDVFNQGGTFRIDGVPVAP